MKHRLGLTATRSNIPVVDGGRNDVPATVRVHQVATVGGASRRQGQHDGAQRRQLIVQLSRLPEQDRTAW
jgi:hypothetical protein